MTCEVGPARRVLVLQGGGALGSYQAGVFEALAGEGVEPQWIAGISIGAINAALIAGNPPERRVERLREFWELASDGPQVDLGLRIAPVRALTRQMNAATVLALGVGGFFAPRFPPPQLQPPGTLEALSYYDTAPLKRTLERLVDFDRINHGEIRFSVGAVNIRSGNFAYFDNRSDIIRAEHIMASGALPPGLPPIEIDGEFYWDGGLVSNTPLDYVLQEETRQDLLVFQVDLFPAKGPMPRTLVDAEERVMDIRYSSRTRLNTDQALRIRHAKLLAREVLDSLPEDLARGEAAIQLRELAIDNAVTVVQLVYRRKAYEISAKDYEFSRATMREHWTSGLRDARRSLEHRTAIMEASGSRRCHTFDIPAAEEETPA
jgi:NTE family protein